MFKKNLALLLSSLSFASLNAEELPQGNQAFGANVENLKQSDHPENSVFVSFESAILGSPYQYKHYMEAAAGGREQLEVLRRANGGGSVTHPDYIKRALEGIFEDTTINSKEGFLYPKAYVELYKKIYSGEAVSFTPDEQNMLEAYKEMQDIQPYLSPNKARFKPDYFEKLESPEYQAAKKKYEDYKKKLLEEALKSS